LLPQAPPWSYSASQPASLTTCFTFHCPTPSIPHYCIPY
jgi:hypothetical protein